MIVVKLPKVLSFEWDKGNEQKNWITHHVSIEEAEEAYADEKRLILDDIRHSTLEERYILLGKTQQGRMLFTIFTIRGERVRVISARDANKKEVRFYEKAINIA